MNKTKEFCKCVNKKVETTIERKVARDGTFKGLATYAERCSKCGHAFYTWGKFYNQ
jgi:hypothetical protein